MYLVNAHQQNRNTKNVSSIRVAHLLIFRCKKCRIRLAIHF